MTIMIIGTCSPIFKEKYHQVKDLLAKNDFCLFFGKFWVRIIPHELVNMSSGNLCWSSLQAFFFKNRPLVLEFRPFIDVQAIFIELHAIYFKVQAIHFKVYAIFVEIQAIYVEVLYIYITGHFLFEYRPFSSKGHLF